MASKWNSRSTVFTLLGFTFLGILIFIYWITNEKIINMTLDLANAGKEIPVVYSEIIRNFPLGEVILGVFTLSSVKVGGEKIQRTFSSGNKPNILPNKEVDNR